VTRPVPEFVAFLVQVRVLVWGSLSRRQIPQTSCVGALLDDAPKRRALLTSSQAAIQNMKVGFLEAFLFEVAGVFHSIRPDVLL
jgi:hypothetical protein